MDLRLNATRRSINLSVYLVFDLETGRFKFLGEDLLGAGAVENELFTLDSLIVLYCIVLYCIVLYCIVLCLAVLCFVLFC